MNNKRYEVALVSSQGYISTPKVEEYLNAGWEILTFAVDQGNYALMYFRRELPETVNFIVINGAVYNYNKDNITYVDVIKLLEYDPALTYSVTYKSLKKDRSGIMIPSSIINLTNGMIFNVAHTGNA